MALSRAPLDYQTHRAGTENLAMTRIGRVRRGAARVSVTVSRLDGVAQGIDQRLDATVYVIFIEALLTTRRELIVAIGSWGSRPLARRYCRYPRRR